MCARIQPTKILAQSKARADVTVKKILRTQRYFYDQQLDNEVKYKQKRNKRSQSFVALTDYLVDKYFDKEIIKLFGFQSCESISNKLAALIQPKCLLNELEHVMSDITLLRKEKAKKDPNVC